jgi:hypothetical protein
VAVTGCILFCFHSLGQVADTSRNAKHGDTVHIPVRADTNGPKRADILHNPTDSSFRLADTTHHPARIDTSKTRGLKNNNIFLFFRNAFSRGGHYDSANEVVIRGRHVDSANLANALNTKSEVPFKPYEGKIIRHITVKGYGFEQSFTDTSKHLQYFGTRVLNSLHRKTRDWVIRNSMFVREGTPLSSFKLADNERLIRSLNFIQDARILVDSVPDSPDSVDLQVVVKDLFSIGGELASLNINPESFRGNVSDANFLGMGQRAQFGVIVEQLRNPNFGYQLLYSKSNIANTFVNATVSHTIINPDLFDGTPDEKATFVRLDRPLYAPYAHIAGDITIGDFQSFNLYSHVDSLFYNYHYTTHDAWMGWNLGSNRFLNNTSVRDRKVVGIRYFQNHFMKVPYQIGDNFNWRFNDREAVLAQFTFFRQDFYKTNYIYGFGTTEDIPYGYNVAFTGGWYKQLYLERPYAGVDANAYVDTKKGGFIQYFLRSGVFMHKGQGQDASILIGSSYYSPLFVFDRIKIRQYVNFSYTRQFNRVGVDPLTIDNVFGLRYFSGDSTFGYQRITLHSETTFFLNFKFIGFKFAPFAFGDLSLLTPEQENFYKSSLYHGIGAGIRSRNENLIFNTIELRAVYFPRKTVQNTSFKIMLNTGIQFRYNNNYVRAPDVVYLNTDGLNSIY